MKLPKLTISHEKMDINTKFYFFLKYLVKASLSDKQILKTIENSQLFGTIESLNQFKEAVLAEFNKDTKTDKNKVLYMSDIFVEIQDVIDLSLFIFSIKLISIKDLLLQEAKLNQARNIEKLQKIPPLSLEYDKITVLNPYQTRVSGALLSLLFFQGLQIGFSEQTDDFLKNLSERANNLIKLGLEPNQIFMLLFNESINQSIISDSGSDYENRIRSVLLNIGIPMESITKIHDQSDKSTEFDLFFELNGRTFGISAKRTLRERYKQFIKTAHMSKIDVMIEITLGTDLTEEKTKSIINHGVYLFVADEIYQQNEFLRNTDGVYTCKDLTLDVLNTLP